MTKLVSFPANQDPVEAASRNAVQAFFHDLRTKLTNIETGTLLVETELHKLPNSNVYNVLIAKDKAAWSVTVHGAPVISVLEKRFKVKFKHGEDKEYTGRATLGDCSAVMTLTSKIAKDQQTWLLTLTEFRPGFEED